MHACESELSDNLDISKAHITSYCLVTNIGNLAAGLVSR